MAQHGDAPAGDFPRTLMEFEDRFASEKACRSYLEALRWPHGFQCPRCLGNRGWRVARELWFCANCDRQTSATAGTIFDRTRKPLRLWFRIMWLVTSQKTGASALNLQRHLGFGRYETVWIWLHKLRRAMVRPDRERLSGGVEIDETYVGGAESDVHGRETRTKSIVVIAAEEDGPGIGRIRLRRIPDVSADSLLAFVQDVVEPGSTVHTDGWRGYNGLHEKGYPHRITNIARSGELAHVLMPRVHLAASLLKRWLLGTHQGAVRPKHLDYYLDEFTFRFNRRESQSRGKLYYRPVQQAAQVAPVAWKEVAAGKRSQGSGN